MKKTKEDKLKKGNKNAAVNRKKITNNRKIAAAACKTKSKSKRCLEWEQADKLILLQGWARDGLAMNQIAHNMGISKETLYQWMKLSSAISDSIKKGKEVSDYLVENALFTSALSGNVVAQIFWLKNRKPNQWQDKVEQKIEAEVEHEGGVVMIAPRLEADDE